MCNVLPVVYLYFVGGVVLYRDAVITINIMGARPAVMAVNLPVIPTTVCAVCVFRCVLAHIVITYILYNLKERHLIKSICKVSA